MIETKDWIEKEAILDEERREGTTVGLVHNDPGLYLRGI